jgi:diguanylate cyclase (GGDEF)-like protein
VRETLLAMAVTPAASRGDWEVWAYLERPFWTGGLFRLVIQNMRPRRSTIGLPSRSTIRHAAIDQGFAQNKEIMAPVLPSEVVAMLREPYADLADHTAVGGERDLRILSGIVAATECIPDELIPRSLASRLTAVIGTIKSAIRAWEVDSRRHHISGREVRELRSVLEQCPDERKWIERQAVHGYVLTEPRPRAIDDIRAAMAEASAIMASCQGAGAPAYDQAHVIWNMLDADLRIELARNGEKKDATSTSEEHQLDPAFVDVLVPLKNRRAFDAECPVLIQAAEIDGETLALVMFDVDHFKQVNDEHGGHETGDEALLGVAEVAQACVKGKGTAYRLGGDEFAILLPNHTEAEAVVFAERLRASVSRTLMTSHELKLSLSIGVSIYPGHGQDPVALKRAADAAAYDAKQLGRDLVRVFGEAAPVSRAREPERKEASPGGLTAQQRQKIRQDYFRHGVARCPHDEAVLGVEDVTSMGQATRSIYVSCPLCGLSEELD